MSFGHQNGFDTVAYITGPEHILLGLRFGAPGPEGIELIKRPPAGGCNHGTIDEARLLQAIETGVARANAETGGSVVVQQAFYIEDDSPAYGLYEHCAYLLASRAVQAQSQHNPGSSA